MKKPNLFIVGQPKAGTTAMQFLLNQHPDIFIYNHGGYFGKDVIKQNKNKIGNKRAYLNLFSKVKNEKIVGDSSEQCFYSKTAATKIKRFNPNARIIILLREPIEWLRSYYQQEYRNLNERGPIGKVITKKDYINRTKYSKYLKNYLKKFNKKNIKIILFEDFRKDNKKVLKKSLIF